MDKFYIWSLVIGNVALALSANVVSTLWASKEDKFSILLLVVVVISPIVFLTFGVVSAKIGLAIGAATIDSLLTISSIIVGLFLFDGWRDTTLTQYTGLFLAVSGVALMHLDGSR